MLTGLAALLAMSSLGLWAYSSFYSDAMTSTHSVPTRVVRPSPTPSESQQAGTVTQKYLQAFLVRDYSSMWTMLDPQMQAKWPDQATFATYWSARFRGYTLQNFTIGTPDNLNRWVDPETMVQYDKVIHIPVSLKLTSQQPAIQTPENLHQDLLFKNLPMIVQRATTDDGSSHWHVLAGGPIDLEAPILPPAIPVEKIAQVPILMYHHISLPTTQSALDQSLAVSPDMFKAHIKYLKEQGYHSVTFNQLFDALYYGAPLPKKPVILTFDDGYDDAYTNAYPILKAQGFSGMFYIITGKVGWKGQAIWEQLREMLNNGMQMGSHTVNHVNLGGVVQLSRDQAQQELQASQSTLQQKLGVPIQQFCYPTGEPFRSYPLATQQEITQMLAQDGYVGATTDPGGPVPAGVDQSSLTPFKLLRLRIDGRATLQDFIGIMSA